jgi:putative oxidoreductase
MSALVNIGNRIVDRLDPAGSWIGLLPIRLLMAWEYGRAGMMKFNGNNWFANVQDNFPFPFNVIPVEISWFLATWVEILGGIFLLFGLFTRFWAFSLIVLTIVAIAGVRCSRWYSPVVASSVSITSCSVSSAHAKASERTSYAIC